MINKLPSYYDNSVIVKYLYEVLQQYIDEETDISDDMKLQFFVDTATWGLDFFEKMFGIETVSSYDYETRRNIIRTKLLGAETTTLDRLREICIVCCGSDVVIEEDYSNYKLEITFLDIYGSPSNYDKLYQQVREILPAHIGFEPNFRYITWGTFANNTYSQLSSLTWEESAVTKI